MATQKDVNAMILAQLQAIGQRLDAIESSEAPDVSSVVDLIPTKAKAKAQPKKATKAKTRKASEPITIEVREGQDKRGNPGLEIVFSDKPSDYVRQAIGSQGLGWGWSPYQKLWYKSTVGPQGKTVPMAQLKREAQAIAEIANK